jgi:hypothetical protein
MTQIALETEVVSTRYDKRTQTGYYTIERDGKRWTIALPVNDFKKFKGATAKQLRRNHLANALLRAMSSPPDPPAGTKQDPFKPSNWDEFDKLKSDAWYVNPADGKLQQKP